MKISEVTVNDIKSYAKIEFNNDDSLLNIILAAVIDHIKSYTGLDSTKLDEKKDLTIVLLVLANEMYENRQYTVNNDKVNVVIKSILDKHCINLL